MKSAFLLPYLMLAVIAAAGICAGIPPLMSLAPGAIAATIAITGIIVGFATAAYLRLRQPPDASRHNFYWLSFVALEVVAGIALVGIGHPDSGGIITAFIWCCIAMLLLRLYPMLPHHQQSQTANPD